MIVKTKFISMSAEEWKKEGGKVIRQWEDYRFFKCNLREFRLYNDRFPLQIYNTDYYSNSSIFD